MSEWHVMIDLETFGTQNDCIINEVGWCVFDPMDTTIALSGHVFLRLDEQEKLLKRTVNCSTIQWWMDKSGAARIAVMTPNVERMSVFLLHDYLTENIDWATVHGVWSHGLTFDIPILTHLYSQLPTGNPPWHYRTPRDTRTLFALVGMPTDTSIMEHTAMADAIAQAGWVQQACRKLTEWRDFYGLRTTELEQTT